MSSGIRIVNMELGKSRRQRALFAAEVGNKEYRNLVIYENDGDVQVHYPMYVIDHMDPELRDRVSEKALNHYRSMTS